MLLRTLHTLQSLDRFNGFTIADAESMKQRLAELDWLLGPRYVLLGRLDASQKPQAPDPLLQVRGEVPLAILFTARAAEAVMEKIQRTWDICLGGEAGGLGATSRVIDIREEMLAGRPRLPDVINNLRHAEDAAAGRSRSIDLSRPPAVPEPACEPADATEDVPTDERVARAMEELDAITALAAEQRQEVARAAVADQGPSSARHASMLARMLWSRQAPAMQLDGEPIVGDVRSGMQDPRTGRRM